MHLSCWGPVSYSGCPVVRFRPDMLYTSDGCWGCAAAAQGQRVGSGRGGSRLDELHNAAMLVANVGGGDGPPTANGQAGHETGTRRSRRQAGRAARGLA